MKGFNKAIIAGNLGADPDTRYLSSGTAVTTFSVATTEAWTDKETGERKERTEWHRIEAWGKLAEICDQYLSKGSQVLIEGKLRTDKYEKDGITRYATKIRADNVQFLGSKDGTSKPPRQEKPQAQPEFDDDIPF